ncbi:unknown [Porphyromonas sp. CAG:1061]|nr:unknown [Porphyromonas sp. CAG:1061]
MRKLPAKVPLFVVTSYSLFLSGWEEENFKILASADLVDLAIVIIFAI